MTVKGVLLVSIPTVEQNLYIFTARDARSEKRGIAIVGRPSVRPSVCLSVCEVDVPWAYIGWVIYFESNCTNNSLRALASRSPKIDNLVQGEHPQTLKIAVVDNPIVV